MLEVVLRSCMFAVPCAYPDSHIHRYAHGHTYTHTLNKSLNSELLETPQKERKLFRCTPLFSRNLYAVQHTVGA